MANFEFMFAPRLANLLSVWVASADQPSFQQTLLSAL